MIGAIAVVVVGALLFWLTLAVVGTAAGWWDPFGLIQEQDDK
jgi:hypothetical protein